MRPILPIPANFVEFHKEGLSIRFRHVRPEDSEAIAESIRTASRETMLHRFFSPIRGLSRDQLSRMLTLDPAREVCIVGETITAQPRIVCGARYVRLQDPTSAEIAITVHDDVQRRGLGAHLLGILKILACADGLRRFEADILAENAAIQRLLRSVFPNLREEYADYDVLHVVIDLSCD